VVVEPAAGGKRPTWGGALPQFLSMAVCQAMRAVLAGDAPLAYLDPRAASALAERRELMAPVFAAGGVERDEAELRWWTYAGGRINATLRYALEAAEPGWRVIPDNFGLKIRGEGVTHAAFEQARARLERAELWEDAELWRRVGASLPDYRLSKFQPLMPPWVAQEVVAEFLLDIEGAWRWLGAAVDARQADLAATALRDTPALRPIARSPDRALVWVDSAEGLVEAARALEAEQTVGLDVETTLKHRTLCLVQIAGATTTYLIDALAVPSLEPLRGVLADTAVTKLIHNAAFERSVLAQHDLRIEGVVDTLEVSRRVRGRGAEGGHSLKAACARELGLDMSKVEQTSDWSVRPLTASQIEYAALDAEVLRELWAALGFG
jgi:ATP-dependent helicase Lhr and Lhr-like helicase